MGIAVNGDFLGFFNLKTSGGRLTIPLPTYQLKRITIIELSISLKSLRTNCLGYIDVQDMYIRGLINYLATPYMISQYPELVIGRNLNPDGIVYFQIPEHLSPVSSIGLSYILEDLGSHNIKNFPAFEVVNFAKDVKEGVGVVVGTPEEQYFDQALLEVIRISSHLIFKQRRGKSVWAHLNGKVIPDNVGIIIATNNSKGYPILIVTGNSDDAVLSASIALVERAKDFVSNFELVGNEYTHLRRSTIILGPKPEYFYISDVYNKSMTFYGEENTFILPLRFLPGMDFLPYSQIIRLYLKTSKYVNKKKSKLKITLGDELLFDESFVGPCSDSGKEVVIPWRSLKPVNFLKFEFKTVPRIPYTDKSLLWVEILPKTRFKMTRKWVIEMPNLSYLKYYAFPFGYSPYSKKTYIIMDRWTEDNFKIYLEFLRFIGSKEVFPEVPILTEKTFKEVRQLGQNAVLIGDFRPVKAKQPYLYETTGKAKSAFLYLSYNLPEDASVFVRLFRYPRKLNAAYGNLALLDKFGDITGCELTHRIKYWGAPKSKFDMRYFFLQNYYRLLLIIPLVLIGIFIALTLLRTMVRGTKKLFRMGRKSEKRVSVKRVEEKVQKEEKPVKQEAKEISPEKPKKRLKRIKK